MKKEKFTLDPYAFILLGIFLVVLTGNILFVFSLYVPLGYFAWTLIWIAAVVQGLILLVALINLIPDPNKKFLRVAHFFGYMLDQEPVDDVTGNISSTFYTTEEMDAIIGISSRNMTPGLLLDVKERAYEILQKDPDLEARCRKVNQFWLTFYKDTSRAERRNGSIMKMCYYREGTLYYPCDQDRKIWNQKKVEWNLQDQKPNQ
jgi:hypothetical protein